MSKLGSIKISNETLTLARNDAKVFGRSIGAQVDHWARIGRAVELTSTFPHDRLRRVIEGEPAAAELSSDDTTGILDAYDRAMATPSPKAIAFFAARRKAGIGVGYDDDGRLVRGVPGGGVEYIDDKSA